MELVSGCVECGLAEPESLASLGGSAPGVVDGILSLPKVDSLTARKLIAQQLIENKYLIADRLQWKRPRRGETSHRLVSLPTS